MNEIDELITELKGIMGYWVGKPRTCESCTFAKYHDDTGYQCVFNRAVPFAVHPNATCDNYTIIQ